MTRRTKVALIAVAAVTIGAGGWMLPRVLFPESDVPASSSPLGSKATAHRGSSVSANTLPQDDRGPWLNRDKALKRLRARWDEIGHGNNHLAEQDALAKEAVEVLSCSAELYGLVEFLQANLMLYGIEKIGGELEALFRSPDAASARDRLAAMTESGINDRTLQKWCAFAGKGCPEDEFEAFHASLKSDTCAQEALFSHNVARMGNTPEEAIQSTLDALAEGIDSPTRLESLKHLFRGDLPPGVDFAKLEHLLPSTPQASARATSEKQVRWHSPDSWNPAVSGRRELFRVWAEADPKAAARYIIANPERQLTPFLSTVAERFSQSDAAGCLEWLNGLPGGPAFDFAAKGAVTYLRMHYPAEARHTASQIENPTLREEALEIAATPAFNPETR